MYREGTGGHKKQALRDQDACPPGPLTGASSRQMEQGVRAEPCRGVSPAAPQGLPASTRGLQQHPSIQQPPVDFVQAESTAENASEAGGVYTKKLFLVCTKKLFLVYLQ